MIKKSIKVLIVIAIISIPTIGITLLVSEVRKETEGIYELNGEGKTISNIEIVNQIKVGNIEFKLLPETSTNIIEAEWLVYYKGIYNPKKFVEISYVEQAGDLKINIYSDISIGAMNYKRINLSLTISISPNYESYSFVSNSEFANLDFRASNINFENFVIISQNGDVDVHLNRSSIVNDFKITSTSGDIDLMLDFIDFSNNFICISDSGNQYIDIWNIKFISSANFNATSVTGLVNVRWANHFNKSHNVNIFLKSDNYAYLKMWSPIEVIRYDILLDATTGTTDFDKPTGLFVEVDVNHHQSYNLNSIGVDMYNITVFTTSGTAYVFIVDCFKWQRFCAQGGDFWPYDVKETGEYTILKQDHTVTTVELYNFKYIYLNTTENITINFEFLPGSSENLVYLNWDLTYTHAMGIGKGLIDVVVSNQTEGDALKVFIELNFELDKILPTFTESNFTAYINQDYTFYNYTI